MALTFSILLENGSVESFSLLGDLVSIGRSRSNDLVLSGKNVSWTHCEVQIVEGLAWLVDLKSANGTFVNGKSISKCKIESGDAISIGEVRLSVGFDIPGSDLGGSTQVVNFGEAMAELPDSSTQYVRHQINNLVQGIGGGAYLLELGVEREDLGLVSEGWRAVGRSQKRMMRLVQDLAFLRAPYFPDKTACKLADLLTEIKNEVIEDGALKHHSSVSLTSPEIECVVEAEGVTNAFRKVIWICDEFGQFAENAENDLDVSVVFEAGCCSCVFQSRSGWVPEMELKLCSIPKSMQFEIVHKVASAHQGEFNLLPTDDGIQACLKFGGSL